MTLGRLFWKFFFAFWLALLLAGAGVGAAVWWHHQNERARLDGERSSALASGPRATLAVSAAASVLEHGGVPALRDLLAEWANERAPKLFVVDDAGQDLFGRAAEADRVEDARKYAASGEPHRPARRVTAPDGQHFVLFVSAEGMDFWPPPPGLDPRAAPGRSDHRPSVGRRSPREPNTWPVILAGLLASIVFSALLAWYLLKPIRNLRWAFGAVAEGRLETRVGPLMGARRDEIADLGADFDRMAQQIQALIGLQHRLLHDVSHELRSPLARLQAAIGLARQNPAQLEATLERIEREAVRLSELVGQLLTLARLDAGARDGLMEAVDLVELTASIAEDARFEAQASGRDLRFEGQGEAEVVVHAELIQRAFENVIRNAVKYTAEGSTVDVTVGVSDGRFILSVADHGPGVPVGDLEAIFEPFYRGQNSPVAGGFGLGLAIARRAIEVHGGSLHADNRANGGLTMEVCLPLLSADDAQKQLEGRQALRSAIARSSQQNKPSHC